MPRDGLSYGVIIRHQDSAAELGRVLPLYGAEGSGVSLKQLGCILADNLSPQKSRVLAMLDRGIREAGTHAAVWHGIDSGGRRLGAGVYLLRLSAGSMVSSRRFVIVR